jgi:acyl phosphate:glycerol-3-phosphate acyltransferase
MRPATVVFKAVFKGVFTVGVRCEVSSTHCFTNAYDAGVWTTLLPIALLAYLFGSIPAGVLVARTYNIDLTKVGSGNTGATNVLRSAGWGPGLVVALADIFKGGIAVLIARALGLDGNLISLVALAAVIGHNFSIFLGFKGGKGVATSFGTVLLLDPGLGLAILPIFVGTTYLTRFVSAGSIIGALAAAVLAVAMQRDIWMVVMCLGLLAMIVFKHRDNIQRLQAGTERRLEGKGKSVAQANPSGNSESVNASVTNAGETNAGDTNSSGSGAGDANQGGTA